MKSKDLSGFLSKYFNGEDPYEDKSKSEVEEPSEYDDVLDIGVITLLMVMEDKGELSVDINKVTQEVEDKSRLKQFKLNYLQGAINFILRSTVGSVALIDFSRSWKNNNIRYYQNKEDLIEFRAVTICNVVKYRVNVLLERLQEFVAISGFSNANIFLSSFSQKNEDNGMTVLAKYPKKGKILTREFYELSELVDDSKDD